MLDSLKVSTVDHPLANPKAAKDIIDGFPYQDPLQTLEEASHWLESISETPAFKVDARYALIDRLDGATRQCQAQLLDTYVALREDNFFQEKRIRNTMTNFWTLLGSAYYVCAVHCSGERTDSAVPRALRAQLPVLAARGLRALRQQIKWGLMRYGAIRPDLWTECGRFAALAESVSAAVQPLELYAGSNGQHLPHDELSRLLVFWAASPSGLSPVEQQIAERLIVHLTPKFRVRAEHNEGDDYFFDVQASHPPLRLVRSSPASATTRYLNVSDALRAVTVMHAMVSGSGHLPAGVDLGYAAEASVVERVLKHFMLHWAREMPARAAARRKTAMALNVVQGYRRVLNVLNVLNVLGVVEPGSADGLDFQSVLAHASWAVDDVSAGGYGMIVPAGQGESLRAGAVIAMRSQADASWQLGMIRRVNAAANHQRHVGVQVIAKAPLPVFLRTLSGVARGGKRQGALLLSEQPATDGSVYIMARRDLFSGREPLEATYGADTTTVILEPGGVVESGHDFDWLCFKLSGLPS